jgi:hypothetical protein
LTRPENIFDASEAQCRQLGDLAAQVAPTPPIDPRQWRQIEAAMQRPLSRRRWLVLLAPALAAAGLVLWLNARRPLEHTVQDCLVAADGLVSSPADHECHVFFEEGTRITLARGTQGRIDALSYRRGASFAIDHGHVDLAVVHRDDARWDVLAGPFDVHVTGTRFAVDWIPSSQRFALRVSEGEVRVSGCRQRPDASVRAGQGLDGDSSANCFEPVPAPAAPVPSVAGDETPVPPHAETTPAPSMRIERKRPLAGGKLAMRSPEPSVKAAHLPPPAAEPSASQLTERDWSVSSGLAPEIKPGPRRLTVGSDGRLSGVEPGTMGAIGGLATTFFYPPHAMSNNMYLEDGALCTRGRIAALNCNDEKLPNMRCDWKTNWGALIQWRPRDGQAWGTQAPSSLALEYRGKSGYYRLVAHRQGDPDDLMYCVDGYRSGQKVTPSQFNLQCWAGGGTHLTDFSKVDYFSLQVMSGETAQRFRLCISAIDLR